VQFDGGEAGIVIYQLIRVAEGFSLPFKKEILRLLRRFTPRNDIFGTLWKEVSYP
jgi:hypothetical protein